MWILCTKQCADVPTADSARQSISDLMDHELFREHFSYVRNALVWGHRGFIPKYEYLERIFFDAILHEDAEEENEEPSDGEKIGDYRMTGLCRASA